MVSCHLESIASIYVYACMIKLYLLLVETCMFYVSVPLAAFWDGLCGFYAAYHMNFMINRAYDPMIAAKVWLIGFTNFAIRSDLALF